MHHKASFFTQYELSLSQYSSHHEIIQIMDQPFPEWKTSLNKEQVLSVLLDLQSEGHAIIYGKPPVVNGWTIASDSPTRWVGIRPGSSSSDSWAICVGNLGRSIGEVRSLSDLIGYLQAALNSQGIALNSPPSQIKMESHQPISNLSKFYIILGSASIKSIWDPYISNETLECLTSLASLGAKISPTLRLLTAVRNHESQLKEARLTTSFFDQFKIQTANEAKFKYCTKEHDRLLILSDGRCLSPDFSLNKIGNRGTINTIIDPKERVEWYETAWATGTEWI